MACSQKHKEVTANLRDASGVDETGRVDCDKQPVAGFDPNDNATLGKIPSSNGSRHEKTGSFRDGRFASGNGNGGGDVSIDQQGDAANRSLADSQRGVDYTAPGNRGRPSFDLTSYWQNADAWRFSDEEQRYQDNVTAILLLKQLEKNDLSPTANELEILAKYSGWRGMERGFSPNHQADPVWGRRYKTLKKTLSKDEWNSIQNSLGTSSPVPSYIAEAMWHAAARLGFRGGEVLAPEIGTGRLLAAIPDEIGGNSTLYGLEQNTIEARLAQKLHPDIEVQNAYLEGTSFPENYFDLTAVYAGSIPNDAPPPSSKNCLARSYPSCVIENSLAKTKPGGLVMVLANRKIMDDKDPRERESLAAKADLVGAFRLPDNATIDQEVTDILFFQKKGGENSGGSAVESDWVTVNSVDGLYDEDGHGIIAQFYEDHPLNNYFAEHPENLLGNIEERRGISGGFNIGVANNPNLETDVNSAVATLPANILSQEVVKERCPQCGAFMRNGVCVNTSRCGSRSAYQPAPLLGVRNGSYAAGDDGLLYQVSGSGVVPLALRSADQEKRALAMIPVRDASRTVLQLNIANADDDQLKKAQRELNSIYDAFVSQYGPVSLPENQRAFKRDPDLALILGLERYDVVTDSYNKAPLFSQRTISLTQFPDKVSTSEEALRTVLAEQGALNWDRMSELCNKPVEELISELSAQQLIFLNPNGRKWELAEEYLSGDIKIKLDEAEVAAALDPRYRQNIEALIEVMPPALSPEDITVNLGSGWIPADVISDFSLFLFGRPPVRADWPGIPMRYLGSSAQWVFELKEPATSWYKNNARSNQVWGTTRITGLELLRKTLNGQTISIYDSKKMPDGKKQRVFNEEETAVAREAQEKLKRAFQQWIWMDEDRKERLSALYNDQFNSLVPRKYDGSYLIFPGQAADMFEMRPHQKNAVARTIQSSTKGENTGLFHQVGAGKTAVMIASSMEMRRLGVKRKIAHGVMNHMVGQYAGDFKRQYPGANILVVGEDEMKQSARQATFAQIISGDYDAIIMSHSAIRMIGTKPETKAAVLEEELAEIEKDIQEALQTKDQVALKALRANKRDMLRKLKKALSASNESDEISWEDLGIDHLFLDEADEIAANLHFSTRRRISGVGGGQHVKQAEDLYEKIRYMNNRCKCGRFIPPSGICNRCLNQTERDTATATFATGTPVRNTLSQMYVMQKYLSWNLLREKGLLQFDAWVSQFGKEVTKLEIKPSGAGYRMHTRLGEYKNVADMMRMVLTFADLQLDSDKLDLIRPDLVGGAPEVVAVEASPWLKRFVQDCEHRLNNLPSDPSIDNPLKIVNDADNAALDVRLIDPNLPDDPNSKVNRVVARTLQVYRETTGVEIDGVEGEHDMTQLLFIDKSTPKDSPVISAKTQELLIALNLGRVAAEEMVDALIAYSQIGNQEQITKLLRQKRIDEDSSAMIQQLLSRSTPPFNAGRDKNVLVSMLQTGLVSSDARTIYRNRFKPIDEIAATVGLPSSTIEFILPVLLRDNFNLYDDIKFKYMRAGVPEDEIAFIHDAQTDEEKQRLFDAVNKGKVRFLLGSTGKMGAGTNVQVRLKNIAHVTIPWRPRDIEQRTGRGRRQGNINKEIHEMRFVTEGSFDVYRYQLLESKARPIAQVLNGDLTIRSVEEIDEAVMDYAHAKAAATGDPIIIEQLQVGNRLRELSMLRHGHTERIDAARKGLARIPGQIENIKKDIRRTQAAMLFVDKSSPLQIGDEIYRTMGRKAETDLMSMLNLYRGVGDTVIAPLGQIYGCPVSIIGSPSAQSYPRLRVTVGDAQFEVETNENPSGNLTRIRNGFASLNQGIQEQQQLLENLQQKIQAHREVLKEKFPYAEEETRLRQRAEEIESLVAEYANGSPVGEDAVSEERFALTKLPVSQLPQALTIDKNKPLNTYFNKIARAYPWNPQQESLWRNVEALLNKGIPLQENGFWHPSLNMQSGIFDDDEQQFFDLFISQFDAFDVNFDRWLIKDMPTSSQDRRGAVDGIFNRLRTDYPWNSRQKAYINLLQSFVARGQNPWGEDGRLHPAFDRISPYGPQVLFNSSQLQLIKIVSEQFVTEKNLA